MYKSPIEIFVKEMQMKQEEQVLKAVQEVGVTVDKDELIKALQYDRGQYEKGFAEGRAKAIKEFAEKLKCGVSITSGIIICADIDNLVKEMVDEQE